MLRTMGGPMGAVKPPPRAVTQLIKTRARFRTLIDGENVFRQVEQAPGLLYV